MTFRILCGVKVCRHKELLSVMMHVFFSIAASNLYAQRVKEMTFHLQLTSCFLPSTLGLWCIEGIVANLLGWLGLLASWCVGSVLGLALSSSGCVTGWLSLGGSPESLQCCVSSVRVQW